MFTRDRTLLEAEGLFDKQRRIQAHDGDSSFLAIPVVSDVILSSASAKLHGFSVAQAELPASASAKVTANQPQRLIATLLLELYNTYQAIPTSDAPQHKQDGVPEFGIPHRWEKYGDLVLLPEGSFSTSESEMMKKKDVDTFWKLVARAFNCQRLGILHAVRNNDVREAHVELLVGDSGVVQHVDNGVLYSWDVTRCMYSSGNITEKLRLAALDCSEEVVVDLFAGIGYFTLVYLKHAAAQHLYACEWNPDAVAALKNNLELNKVQGLCCFLG